MCELLLVYHLDSKYEIQDLVEILLNRKQSFNICGLSSHLDKVFLLVFLEVLSSLTVTFAELYKQLECVELSGYAVIEIFDKLLAKLKMLLHWGQRFLFFFLVVEKAEI